MTASERMWSKMKLALFGAAVSLALAALPATAQETPASGRNVIIGVGLQSVPKYPGAGSAHIAVLPLVDLWRVGEPMPVETPDESFGFALVGQRGRGIAIGPVIAFAPSRSAGDAPGLASIGTAVEVGMFAEAWPVKSLRLRTELRQGIGGHRALNGDLATDLVWRQGDEGAMLTIGPRVRWGSGKYNRAYFGIPLPGSPGLAAYTPGSGIIAVGGLAGLRFPLTRSLGLYGYLRYDRLTEPAAGSPIVQNGSADQFSGGLALTYRFTL